MMRREGSVYLAAAWCLSYPDEELLDRLPLIRSLLAGHPGAGMDFEDVLVQLEAGPAMDVQAAYVREFDLGQTPRTVPVLLDGRGHPASRRGAGGLQAGLPGQRVPGGHAR